MKRILKRALVTVLTVVLLLTAAPLGGFAEFDLPDLFNLDVSAVDYESIDPAWSLSEDGSVLTIGNLDELYSYAYEYYLSYCQFGEWYGAFGFVSALQQMMLMENMPTGCREFKIEAETENFFTVDGALYVTVNDSDFLVFYPENKPEKNIYFGANDIYTPYTFINCRNLQISISDEFTENSINGYWEMLDGFIEEGMADDEVYAHFTDQIIIEGIISNVFLTNTAECFTVSDTNKHLHSEDGVLYSKDESVVIKFPIDSQITFISVDNFSKTTYNLLSSYPAFVSFLGSEIGFFLGDIMTGNDVVYKEDLNVHITGKAIQQLVDFYQSIAMEDSHHNNNLYMFALVMAGEICSNANDSVIEQYNDIVDILKTKQDEYISEKTVEIPDLLERYPFVKALRDDIRNIETCEGDHEPPHEQHSYSSSVTTPPTCTEDGEMTYTCTCGDVYTENIPAIGHTKDTIIETESPLCGIYEGYITYYCSNCDQEYDEWIWFDEHTKDEIVGVVEPVCGEVEGYTVYHCSNCDQEYDDDQIWFGEHAKGEIVEKVEPICGDTEGYIVYSCSNCGNEFTEWLWYDEHTKGEIIEKFEPVCGESEGYTLYCCSVCEEAFYDDWIWYDEHTKDEIMEEVKPVCGESDGYIIYLCSNCGQEHTEWVWIAHTKGEKLETVDPICGEWSGYTRYTCSNCGEEYNDDIIWIDHVKGDNLKTVEPVCGKSHGYSLYKCSNCNKQFVTDTIWSDHEGELIETVEATCVTKGYSVYNCNSCSEQYFADYTDATEHNFIEGVCSGCGINQNDLIESSHPYDDDLDQTWTISKPGADSIAIIFSEASELENGWDYLYVYDSYDNEIVCLSGTEMAGRTVIVPGESAEIRLITDSSSTRYGFSLSKVVAYYDECTEHTNTKFVNKKEAKCWENGYSGDLICLDCGVIIEEGSNINSAHTKSEPLYTIEPTCNESGYTRYFCNICGSCFDDDYVDPQHSSPIVLEVVNPVCGGEGYTVYQCSDCGEEYTEWTYLEHTKGEVIKTVATVCGESDGYTVYSCSNCGEEYKDDWNWLDHTKGEVIKTVDPVCGETSGYTVYICSNCGKEYKDDWDWKNHDGELIETTPATCTNDSYNILRCNDCEAEYKEWNSERLGHAMINGKCTRCDAVATEIKINALTDVNITTEGDIISFMFTPEVDGTYYFYSDSNSDTYGYLYDSEANLLETCDDYDDGNFMISYDLSAGETYYIASSYYSSDDTGSFKIKVSDEFKSNHSYEFVETILPTCVREGYELYVCSICGRENATNYVDEIGHNYTGGICEICGCHEGNHHLDFKPVVGSTTVIDQDCKIVYGLNSGLTIEELLDDYVQPCDDTFVYYNGKSIIGTGEVVTVMNQNGVTLAEYTVIIFGDVNGDGWYDGQDAVLVSCLANGMLTKDDVSEAVYMAADCNHDGVIDSLDIALLEQAGVLLASVDQSKPAEVLLETSSAYVEYLDLIDQSPEIEVEYDTETDVEPNVPESDDTEEDTEDSTQQGSVEFGLIDMIINLIKSIFETILAYIPVLIK